jgi:hypothetical protein
MVRHSIWRFRLIAIIASALFMLPGCLPESQLDLSPGSRLPRWFTIPPGLTRKDVSVTEENYIASSGRSAVFKLWNKERDKIDEVTATVRGREPTTLTKKNPQGGFDLHYSYPLYEVMTARGVTEVFEFRAMDPFVYVNDDPEIKYKLGLGSAHSLGKAT